MKCISCEDIIPKERLDILPETKKCVQCSDEEKVGCVDITYHKTGNTIQIMPKSQAEKINKAAKRNGFGTLAGMKGGSGESKQKISLNTNKNLILIKHDQELFEKIGKEMMDILEISGKDKALLHINKNKESRLLSPIQYRKLKTIIDFFSPVENKKEDEKVNDKLDIDKEILLTFKNRRI